MDPHERAVSCWYRVAGLVSREQKTLAVEIIAAEIRSAVHEVLPDAARLVLSGDPVEIARQLRDRRSGRYGQRRRRHVYRLADAGRSNSLTTRREPSWSPYLQEETPRCAP